MTSSRRMRRQARRIRRGGMQPMMFITGNDQLPETAMVLILRVGVAVPLRTRPALRGRRRPRRRVLAACRPSALVGARCGHRGHDVSSAGRVRRPGRASHNDRAAVRGRDHARRRRMDGRRSHRRPVHHADAAAPGDRGSGLGGALVGACSPTRPGPRGAQARSLAGDRPGGRAGRLAGHVRHGGRVGLAGPVPAGPGPDHHRRDRQDSRPGIRPGHLPRSRPRLPHPRRPGQPVRAAGARHGPARRRRSPGPARR